MNAPRTAASDRLAALNAQIAAAERELGTITQTPDPDIGPTIGGLVTAPFSPPVQAVGTGLGYMAQDLYLSRPLDPVGSLGKGTRDVMTGEAFGRGLSLLGKTPPGRLLKQKAGDVAAPYVEKLGEGVASLRELVRRPDPQAPTIEGTKRALIKDPRHINEGEKRLAAKSIEGRMTREGANLTPADVGDPGALWLESQAAKFPFSKTSDKVFARINQNKTALRDLREKASYDELGAGVRVSDAVADADEYIRAIDHDIFESVIDQTLDTTAARRRAAVKMFDGHQIQDPQWYQNMPEGERHLSKEVSDILETYRNMTEEMAGFKEWTGGVGAPARLNSFRMRVFDEMQAAQKEGRKTNATVLSRVYGSLVDTQGEFLDAATRDGWRAARKRWAEYESYKGDIKKLVSGDENVSTLINKITSQANGTKMLDAIEWFTRQVPGGMHSDVLEVVQSAKVGQLLRASSGSQSFLQRLAGIPEDVRRRFDTDKLYDALGLAQMEDMVKGVERKMGTPGAGDARLQFNSVVKWLTFGHVSDDLAQLYQSLPPGSYAKMTEAGKRAFVKIAEVVTRKHVRESVVDPYIYPPIKEAADQTLRGIVNYGKSLNEPTENKKPTLKELVQ